MDAAREHAGVDAPGDGGVLGDLRHDGDAQDLCDVGRPQAPGRLIDQDHPVVAARLASQEAAQGEVARSPDHDVPLVGVGALRALQRASGVEDDQAGRRSLAPAEVEVGDHRDGAVIGVGRSDPQEGRHVRRVVGDELGGLVPGTEQGDRGGDRAGTMPAPGSADTDGSCHVNLLNGSLNGFGRSLVRTGPGGPDPPWPGARLPRPAPGGGDLSTGPPSRWRRRERWRKPTLP